MITMLALCALLPHQTAPRVPLPDAPPARFDRGRATATTLRLVRALVAIDSTNPPGRERAVAEAIAAALPADSGFECVIHDVPGYEADGRANLTARLRAKNATARPLLLLGHMDVVGADAARWSSEPFVPTEVDGWLQGRGVMDDKGPLAATVAALLELAGQRDRLERDVILLATAAEEGGPEVGIDWMVEHHRELFGDAEFALNEGGRVRLRDGRVATVNLQTTEKVYHEVRVTAQGSGGHGSVPLRDNAIAALARAVARVHDWRAPLSLNETTRAYFQRLATIEPDRELAAAMRAIGSDDPKARARAEAVLSGSPLHDAVLRSGLSLTMFDGGFRANVIPPEATAVFNLRTVPGDDARAIVAEMARVAAEDSVTFELTDEPGSAPPPSPVDSALFRSLEAASHAMAPTAVVLPFMSTGATDGAALRAIGIPTYGILPFPLDTEDELRMHGDDERVPLASFAWGTEFLYRTIAGVTLPAEADR